MAIWDLNEIYKKARANNWPRGATTGLAAGGITPGYTAACDTFTVETAGDTTDFGDLTGAVQAHGGVGSFTRGVFAGGTSPYTADIEKVEIASTGNSINYGDLTAARGYVAGTSNSVRGIQAGGNPGSSPNKDNVIDYQSIAHGGTALDFGDLNNTVAGPTGGSNCHGGLNDGYQGTRP